MILVFLFFSILSPSYLLFAQDIQLHIDNPKVRQWTIAIPPFTKITSQNNSLDYSTSSLMIKLWKQIPMFSILENMDNTSPNVIDYTKWRVQNVDFFIHGVFLQENETSPIQIELRLFDVLKRQQIIGKKYNSLTSKNISNVLRRFADLSLEEITQKRGILTTKIAFVGNRKWGQPKQLFLINFDGTDLEQITENHSINMSPSWSIDGTQVTFTSFKEGKAEIFAYNLITKRIIKLVSCRGNCSGAHWHPNGDLIAFSGSFRGNTSIFTASALDGSQHKEIISGVGLEVEPAYAPNGRYLAYTSGRLGRPHIFVRDLILGLDKQITLQGWHNVSPSWRYDSKKIVFSSFDKHIDHYDIFSVDMENQKMERLTVEEGDNEKPSWSPDGQFVVFQSDRLSPKNAKVKKLFIMREDGSHPEPISLPLEEAVMPSWSPYLQFNTF